MCPNWLFTQGLVGPQVDGFGQVDMTQTEVTIQRPPRCVYPFGDSNHGCCLVFYEFLQNLWYEVPGWVDVLVIL